MAAGKRSFETLGLRKTSSTVFSRLTVILFSLAQSMTWAILSSIDVLDVLKMNRTEMSMIRWICGVKLNERKNEELLGLEPVSLMIKKSRLRWFGHVE